MAMTTFLQQHLFQMFNLNTYHTCSKNEPYRNDKNTKTPIAHFSLIRRNKTETKNKFSAEHDSASFQYETRKCVYYSIYPGRTGDENGTHNIITNKECLEIGN